MPYIQNSERVRLDDGLVDLDQAIGLNPTPGQLNYLITKLCAHYVELYGRKYETFNDVVGALECAKQEFYRRVVVPYEEEKRNQNGDVY